MVRPDCRVHPRPRGRVIPSTVRTQRKLAAIVFADIAGFSQQVSQDETAGLERRRQIEQLIKGSALGHGGRVVKTIGDAVMLEFYSAVEAVSCGLEVQKEVQALNLRLAPAPAVLVRIGVHVGDVVEEEGDLYGNGVNIAQRVQTIAEPGGICISREVYVQIRPILKLRFALARTPPEKPMPEAMEVYSIGGDGLATETSAPGVEPTLVSDTALFLRQAIDRNRLIDIPSCFRRAWGLVKTHFWIFVLAALIFHTIWVALSAVKLVGAVATLVLVGPLEGGFSWFILRTVRGQPPRLTDLWIAFGPLLVPVVIAGVASGILRDFGVWLVRNASELSTSMSQNNLEFLLKVSALLLVPAVYFYVAWMFGRLLVIDKRLAVWAALELSRRVVTRHWLNFFLFAVASVGIILSGVLFFGIGILVTFPLGLAMLAYAYEDIFSPPPLAPPGSTGGL